MVDTNDIMMASKTIFRLKGALGEILFIFLLYLCFHIQENGALDGNDQNL